MKNFDWSKWSAIAEIFSAVAIVITLVYLSIQTAQNTQAIRASAARDVARDETAAIELLIDNPELFLAFDSEEISAADAVKVHAFLAVFTRAQENYWAQYKLGVIDEVSIDRYQRSFSSIFQNERAGNWWHSQKSNFDPEFSAKIDNLLVDRPVWPMGSLGPGIQSMFEHQP